MPATIPTDISMAILSPFSIVFLPSVFIIAFTPHDCFFPFHPSPHSCSKFTASFITSLAAGAHLLSDSLYYFSWGFALLSALLECLYKESSSYRNLATSVAWFRAIAVSKKPSASTAIQTLLPLFFPLSNCWITQINKLNCTSITKYSSSSGLPHFWHTGFGSEIRKQHTHWLKEGSGKISGNVFNRGIHKMRSPEERPIQVCRFWHVSSFWVTPTLFLNKLNESA